MASRVKYSDQEKLRNILGTLDSQNQPSRRVISKAEVRIKRYERYQDEIDQILASESSVEISFDAAEIFDENRQHNVLRDIPEEMPLPERDMKSIKGKEKKGSEKKSKKMKSSWFSPKNKQIRESINTDTKPVEKLASKTHSLGEINTSKAVEQSNVKAKEKVKGVDEKALASSFVTTESSESVPREEANPKNRTSDESSTNGLVTDNCSTNGLVTSKTSMSEITLEMNAKYRKSHRDVKARDRSHKKASDMMKNWKSSRYVKTRGAQRRNGAKNEMDVVEMAAAQVMDAVRSLSPVAENLKSGAMMACTSPRNYNSYDDEYLSDYDDDDDDFDDDTLSKGTEVTGNNSMNNDPGLLVDAVDGLLALLGLDESESRKFSEQDKEVTTAQTSVSGLASPASLEVQSREKYISGIWALMGFAQTKEAADENTEFPNERLCVLKNYNEANAECSRKPTNVVDHNYDLEKVNLNSLSSIDTLLLSDLSSVHFGDDESSVGTSVSKYMDRKFGRTQNNC